MMNYQLTYCWLAARTEWQSIRPKHFRLRENHPQFKRPHLVTEQSITAGRSNTQEGQESGDLTISTFSFYSWYNFSQLSHSVPDHLFRISYKSSIPLAHLQNADVAIEIPFSIFSLLW